MQRNTDKEKVASHYEELHGAYLHWTENSDAGFHFGVARSWKDIFTNHRMLQNLNDEIMACIPHDAKKILDAGCGMGHLVAQIDKNAQGRKAEIVGITISPEQKSAGEVFLQSKNARAKILQQDFEHTNFPSETFDVVLYLESLVYGTGENKRQAVAEATRILKPGGTMLIADAFLQKPEDQLGKLFTFLNKKTKKFWSIQHWIEEPSFKRVLQNNGMNVVEEEDLKLRAAPSALHILLYWLPKTCMLCLVGKEPPSSLRYIGKLLLYVLPFGLHPAFRYKRLVIRKQKAYESRD